MEWVGLVSLLFIKAITPIIKAPFSWHTGIRASTYKFGGDKHLVHNNTFCLNIIIIILIKKYLSVC